MIFKTDLEVPPRYQSEPSSDPSESVNCGVTVAVAIADFYLDRKHAIEPARKLIEGMGPYDLGKGIGIVKGAPSLIPTNSRQQADILRKFGIPSTVTTFTKVKQLHDIVDSLRRPVLLGLQFSHVPNETSGYSKILDRWHAIKVRAPMARQGESGFAVNDPNFWPGNRDATNGMRFYSDAVMQRALDGPIGGCKGVAPDAAKAHAGFTEDNEMSILSRIEIEMAPHDFPVRRGVTLHKGPGFNYPVHWTLPSEQTFRVAGWDVDPMTKQRTNWVFAFRPGGTGGTFFVPPDHAPHP
jgi:hypothetical protein